MLTPQEYRELMKDRGIWLIDQLGPEAVAAVEELMELDPVNLMDMARAAERHRADPLLVAALHGWLPTKPDGGLPLVHAEDHTTLGVDAYLVSPTHAHAWVLYEDLRKEARNDSWRPYPYIRQSY